jgi:hypothetical protein
MTDMKSAGDIPMNTSSFGAAASEPMPDKSLDAAWNVLEAANDLGDYVTVEACRRVIDASLNGTVASQADLHIVIDYFR